MESPNLTKLEDTALEVAKEAGQFLGKNLGRVIEADRKSSRIDLVTQYDKKSEAMIVDIIRDRWPDHAILAEESVSQEKSSPYKWIIDPLDGTTNYAHGYPVFSVSVALQYQEEIIVGVVYDPVREEIFQATRDKKVTLNGNKIRVSEKDSLGDSLLATGFPYDLGRMDKNLKFFGKFAHKAQGLRRAGSAALDLSYVACGRLDGFWEFDLHPWDLAAGSLVVEMAGGKLSNFQGKKFSVYHGQVLATNGRIHESMVEVLNSK